MTARKPVTPPAPKLTRPLAQPQATPKNPITTEIMQRVRRVIRDSRGLITTKTIAQEIHANPNQVREWVGSWRSTPYGDNLIKICRWLTRHDFNFISEIIGSKRIRFRGAIQDITTRAISDKAIADIRTSDESGTVLAARHNLHPTMIGKIRNGIRYQVPGVAAAAPQHPSPAPRSLRRPATE